MQDGKKLARWTLMILAVWTVPVAADRALDVARELARAEIKKRSR